MIELMPIILDLVSLLIIFGYLIRGWKRGFVRMLVQFVGSLALLWGCYALSTAISAPLTQLFRNSLVAVITEQLKQSLGGDTQQILIALLIGLSTSLQESLFGQSFDMSMLSDETALAELLTDSTLVPMMTPVVEWLVSCLTTVAFIILFGIGSAILSWLVNKIQLRHVFLVGFLDTGAGALVGVLQGILGMILLTCAVSLLLKGSLDGWDWLNSQIIEQSTLFRFFYSMNPLKL